MPQTNKYDRLTIFIFMKMHKDKKLSISDLKSLGITYNYYVSQLAKYNIDFHEDNFYLNHSRGIDTLESNAAIKSYLLGEITREELSILLDVSNPTYRIYLYRKKYGVENVAQLKEKSREETMVKCIKGEITYANGAENLRIKESTLRCATLKYIKKHPELQEYKYIQKNLKDKQRDAILMQYYRNEISMKEAAKFLGCSSAYVPNIFKRFIKEKGLPHKEGRSGSYTKIAPYNDPTYEYLFIGYLNGKYSGNDIARELNVSRPTVYNYMREFKKSHKEFSDSKARKKAKCLEHSDIIEDYLHRKIDIDDIMKLGIFKNKQNFYRSITYYRKINNKSKPLSAYEKNIEIFTRYFNQEISREEAVELSTYKNGTEFGKGYYQYKIRHDIPVRKIKKKEE